MVTIAVGSQKEVRKEGIRMAEASPFALHPSLRAFTLTEGLIATGLGAVMFTALFATFAYGFRVVQLSREDLRATQVLVEKMEAVRVTPYAQLQNFNTNINAYYDPSDATNGHGGTVYTINLSTSAPVFDDPYLLDNYGGTSNFMAITATVTWTNGGTLRTRTLQTFASRFGIENYVFAPYIPKQ
jgi:hypothetical protein